MSPSFNPRARVGRDSSLTFRQALQSMFQSTRPRGARPAHNLVKIPLIFVSIHAPAWGATAARGRSIRMEHVSIHAPAWGATAKASQRGLLPASFNPRARVGRDFPGCFSAADTLDVSIHAPAWGATVAYLPRAVNPAVSIHAPAWGATSPAHARRRAPHCFNPRARVGRDQKQAGSRWQEVRFNPRARVGRDSSACLDTKTYAGVSIHAPAWGATTSVHPYFQYPESFNPRARVGRDPNRLALR